RLARLHGARELRLDAIEERAQALERLAVAGPRLLVVAAEVRAIALLVDGDHVLVGLAAPALDRAQAQALERRQQLAQHFVGIALERGALGRRACRAGVRHGLAGGFR